MSTWRVSKEFGKYCLYVDGKYIDKFDKEGMAVLRGRNLTAINNRNAETKKGRYANV